MSSELVNNRTCKQLVNNRTFKQPMALASNMPKNLITKHKGGIRVCLLIKSHEEKAFGFAVHCRNNRPEKAWYFVVCDVASDSPAERSAVRIGDRIVGVDGASIFNEPYKTTVRRLKDARSQLSMILLVADPEAFEEYSALGIPINALTSGAIVVIGEPPGDAVRESSHKCKDERRATSLEDDAESVDEVINYLDALPQEDEQTSKLDKQAVSPLSRKMSLFKRLRRTLRRKHVRKRRLAGLHSTVVAEREDCGAASSAMGTEREEGGATPNPTCGREQHDSSLEDDSEERAAVSPLSRKMSLFKRLRRTPRRKRVRKRGLAHLHSTIVAEREDCGAASSAMGAECEEGGATSNPTCGREQHDSSLEDDSEERADKDRSYLDDLNLEKVVAELEQCAATTSLPVTFMGGETLSTVARTRSVKLPLMERIHQMLSRLGHHTKHHECTSLGNEATSLPPAVVPTECEETSTPTFISTFSIRLKPAQLPQQNHLLYQLRSDRSFKIIAWV